MNIDGRRKRESLLMQAMLRVLRRHSLKESTKLAVAERRIVVMNGAFPLTTFPVCEQRAGLRINQAQLEEKKTANDSKTKALKTFSSNFNLMGT